MRIRPKLGTSFCADFKQITLIPIPTCYCEPFSVVSKSGGQNWQDHWCLASAETHTPR